MVKAAPGLCTGRCHNLPTRVQAQVPSGQPWPLAQCSRRQSPGREGSPVPGQETASSRLAQVS